MATAISNHASNQPLTFKAVWTEENKCFKETLCDRITRCVFFILNGIARMSVLPASRTSKKEIAKINEEFQRRWSEPFSRRERILAHQFTPHPIEATTPNGIKVYGTWFKNALATDASPTVIFFQPNAEHSKQGTYDWILEQAALQRVPYNFISFDYRGCDGTNNDPGSKKDLFLDGESIYQLVRDKLHVPPKDIHFYGWSLGGGVSAHVKKIHKECNGRYVNERSFKTVIDVIKNFVHPVLAWIGGMFISLLNWNISAAKAMENLKGKTLIVHHPDDELMKKPASLYRHFFETRAGNPHPEITHLDLSRANKKPHFIHAANLSFFANDTFNAQAEITKFLFNRE